MSNATSGIDSPGNSTYSSERRLGDALCIYPGNSTVGAALWRNAVV